MSLPVHDEETSRFSAAKRKLLEKYLGGKFAQGGKPPIAIAARPSNVPVPLSFSQEQVWMHCQLAGDVPLYNEPITIFRRGSLNAAVLERCLVEIIRRHEALRTTIDVTNGRPVQVVHSSPASFPLKVIDLRHVEESRREQEACRLATDEARRPFDLKNGPLFRALLVSLADGDDRLYMTFHQLIFDAFSAYRILLPELAALYQAFSAGQCSPLPEVSLQYGDYAYWQREQASQESWSKRMEFWTKKLAGDVPVLAWPYDRSRPAVQSHRGAIQKFHMPPDLLHALRAFCQREGVSLYMALVSAFAAVLHRYSAQEEVILGSLSAGRKRPELEKTLGFFVNPFALRVTFSRDPSFRELLHAVRQEVLDGLNHDDLPFERVVRALQARPDPSRNPLFQIILSMQPQFPTTCAEWNLATEEVSNGGSKVDLMIVIDDRGDGLFGPITFNPDLFDAETISQMIEHWQALLEHAIAEPDRRVSELPILAEAARRRMLIEWNATRQPSAAVATHELFETQAKQTPERVAVSFEGQSLTYGELDARANQLARLLRKAGVGPDVLAGISVDRSLGMLVALLAVWKAGGAYVPLEPDYPAERLTFMVKDSGLQLVVTQEKYRSLFSSFGVRTICLDSDADKIAEEGSECLQKCGSPSDLAYVIYTSGSTGTPKGVQIEHRSVVNFLFSMQSKPGLSAEDVLLAVTTISFDIAGLELYLPLSVGARVVLASRETARDAERLQKLMAESQATCMQATPATWRMLINAGWAGDRQLTVLCGGEALTADLARKLLERSSKVWNLYGPTETTIWSALHQVTIAEDLVPIGRPIANTQIYVLDDRLRPVPPGIPGDLYIGGAGLARGYLNRPDLTAEKFIPHPFPSEGSSSRIYKTGDVARYQFDGTIVFCGRRDDQVKVRGFRIELDEIIAHINQHPAVRASIATAQEDATGEKRLVAYVVRKNGAELRESDLHEHLRRHLPEYMVPAAFVLMDALPLTSNGKVDRKALPRPDEKNTLRTDTLSRPASAVEQRVADILAVLLQVRAVGPSDNFFLLGGHSLLAAQFVSRLRESFGVELTLRHLFDTPTVAGISGTIDDLLLKPKRVPSGSSPGRESYGAANAD